MIPAGGLNRQLVVSMVAVTGLALATMIAGMIVFYGFVFLNLYPPEEFEAMPDSAWPTRSEWVAFLILWSLGLSVAMVAATRFARRLIRPLDQVASAARRIATGDLAARAVPDGLIFEETRQLVEDFNAMATQLSRVDIEMKTWHAAIAHELRTPLTILRGQLQGFVDGVFVPDKASLQGLVGQVESLGRIVDDLKILSLAQSGRLELRLEAIDLAREAATVIRIARPDLEAAGLSVEPDLASVEIDGDGARIRQALMALLDNARRHAAPGKLRIETRDTRDHAVLRVSDTGPGMTAQAIAQAFEPFWRADDSRSRESGGTGLGLAVVRAIAQAHGGTVVAGAVVPHGAVFELQFPRQLSSERRNGSLRPGAPAFRELGH